MSLFCFLLSSLFVGTVTFATEIHSREANITGCKLLSVTPNSNEDLELLKNLYNQEIFGTDFWSAPTPLKTNVVIQVCKEAEENITRQLQDNGMYVSVNIEDLQSAIDEQMAELEIQGRFDKNSGFNGFSVGQYHRLDDILDFLEVAAKEHPNKIRIARIGKTVEGRNLTVVKLGMPSSSSKPAIFISSGLHSREWVSIATTLYVIHQMVSSSDSSTLQLLRMYDWYFLPVANPDGYEYTWSKGEVSRIREYYHPRLWRKNRSKSTKSICMGVDLNRNFDIDFTGQRSSSNAPCSSLYKGSQPFSEKESEVIKHYVFALKDHLKAFVDIHSFGQMWMTPYGYKNEKPKDFNDMLEVANLAVGALESVSGTKYKVGTITDTVYGASGSSVDWAHEVVGVKYSYALEVRDTGKRGFLLSQEEIIPNAKEIYAALTKMATEIANRELNNLGAESM